ncbi:hypothetical protein ACFOJE_15940 [Azotobacter bryophylli]|uniref:Uncharacterized protein n=1 Tax=Azotobacter bryophylli TaxID=1986537 RepID=A0ABV7AXB5_9GAMM
MSDKKHKLEYLEPALIVLGIAVAGVGGYLVSHRLDRATISQTVRAIREVLATLPFDVALELTLGGGIIAVGLLLMAIFRNRRLNGYQAVAVALGGMIGAVGAISLATQVFSA